MLAVSEVFYSIQGEGVTTGVPSVFVRLAGCNLMCGGNGTEKDGQLHNGATWRCDSIEVWRKGKRKEYSEILNQEQRDALLNGARLIITGGEPLLQQEAVNEFINYLRDEVFPFIGVEIETNGTIEPIKELKSNVSQWNVSPKLSNSGTTLEERFDVNVLMELGKLNTQFKFVVSDLKDWEEIKTKYHFIDTKQIVLMPAGSDIEQLNQTRQLVADICKENYLRMTTRLHIDIWNKKTGV